MLLQLKQDDIEQALTEYLQANLGITKPVTSMSFTAGRGTNSGTTVEIEFGNKTTNVASSTKQTTEKVELASVVTDEPVAKETI